MGFTRFHAFLSINCLGNFHLHEVKVHLVCIFPALFAGNSGSVGPCAKRWWGFFARGILSEGLAGICTPFTATLSDVLPPRKYSKQHHVDRCSHVFPQFSCIPPQLAMYFINAQNLGNIFQLPNGLIVLAQVAGLPPSTEWTSGRVETKVSTTLWRYGPCCILWVNHPWKHRR